MSICSMDRYADLGHISTKYIPEKANMLHGILQFYIYILHPAQLLAKLEDATSDHYPLLVHPSILVACKKQRPYQ